MMKLAVIAAVMVAVAVASLTTNTPMLTKDFADKLNAAPGMTWTATHQNGIRVTGASKESIKALMGVQQRIKKSTLPARQFTEEEMKLELPDSFESAEKWPTCPTITTIRDQSACGSCWAVAGAEAMSDRYCTFGGPKDIMISAANLMECCWYCGNGCGGGQPSLAWDYWTKSGLYADSCQPYPFPKCEHHISGGRYPPCPKNEYPTPQCQSTCSANATGTATKHFGAQAWTVSGEDAFKRELFTNGPFEVAFDVYSDFPLYKSGVYVQKSGEFLGGHAVRIVGWGSLDGVPYWKIANSWNTDWGMNGYFLIKRGVDECGIEDAGAAGKPRLP